MEEEPDPFFVVHRHIFFVGPRIGGGARDEEARNVPRREEEERKHSAEEGGRFSNQEEREERNGGDEHVPERECEGIPFLVYMMLNMMLRAHEGSPPPEVEEEQN